MCWILLGSTRLLTTPYDMLIFGCLCVCCVWFVHACGMRSFQMVPARFSRKRGFSLSRCDSGAPGSTVTVVISGCYILIQGRLDRLWRRDVKMRIFLNKRASVFKSGQVWKMWTIPSLLAVCGSKVGCDYSDLLRFVGTDLASYVNMLCDNMYGWLCTCV